MLSLPDSSTFVSNLTNHENCGHGSSRGYWNGNHPQWSHYNCYSHTQDTYHFFVMVILGIHTIFCTIQLIILLMQVNQSCRMMKQIWSQSNQSQYTGPVCFRIFLKSFWYKRFPLETFGKSINHGWQSIQVETYAC